MGNHSKEEIMKQNTLQYNYLVSLIQHLMVEIQWFKVKLTKTVRSLKTKNDEQTSQIKHTDFSYKQEYLLTTVQDRIVR